MHFNFFNVYPKAQSQTPLLLLVLDLVTDNKQKAYQKEEKKKIITLDEEDSAAVDTICILKSCRGGDIR